METTSSSFHNTIINKILLISSILVCLFWILSRTIDVYNYAIVGAIYEMLWLPCIVSLIIIPLVSLIFLIKDKFNLRSLNLFSLIVMTLTLLIIYNVINII
ncbi:magnesium-transporting ATPase (P-type) [Chryseobacterium sp. 16F]|uniref:Magnesium-transporting ATPase (P-type) n=1 Tax=Frigoriflavimonas asaccharolytica TaxID=2735899 RepID=A0A8J8G4E5_9FLAO|nr:magnesium-transporting ATPase (P-type) [Frigoriflavimonas asaccharolytica]